MMIQLMMTIDDGTIDDDTIDDDTDYEDGILL